jgi:hypothetical protein
VPWSGGPAATHDSLYPEFLSLFARGRAAGGLGGDAGAGAEGISPRPPRTHAHPPPTTTHTARLPPSCHLPTAPGSALAPAVKSRQSTLQHCLCQRTQQTPKCARHPFLPSLRSVRLLSRRCAPTHAPIRLDPPLFVQPAAFPSPACILSPPLLHAPWAGACNKPM